MTNAHKATAVLAVSLAGFLACAGYGWMKEHDAAMTISAQAKADSAAAAALQIQEVAQQAKLADVLKAYASLKQTVQTPAQIVQALPQVIQLPAPIYKVSEEQAKASASSAIPNAPVVQAGDLIIPQSDAKAFYDSQVDCKAGAAKLASCGLTTANLTSLNDLKDGEIKQYQIALKGGTKWQRTKSALKYVGIGAAVGAGVGAYLTHK